MTPRGRELWQRMRHPLGMGRERKDWQRMGQPLDNRRACIFLGEKFKLSALVLTVIRFTRHALVCVRWENRPCKDAAGSSGGSKKSSVFTRRPRLWKRLILKTVQPRAVTWCGSVGGAIAEAIGPDRWAAGPAKASQPHRFSARSASRFGGGPNADLKWRTALRRNLAERALALRRSARTWQETAADYSIDEASR
jgi:hypothetical protein